MLVRWTDFDDAFRTFDLFSDMRGLLGDVRRAPIPSAPHVHVNESDDAVTLSVDLPGLGDKDVAITLERGVLEIRAERVASTPPADGFKRLVIERGSFKFQKRFALPDHIDGERVEASMKDGVLTVHMPKSEAAKPKTIVVRGA